MSTISTPSRETPIALAWAFTAPGFPSRTMPAVRRRITMAADCRMRSSPDSGSTMRIFFARAISFSWYSNMSGVRTSDGASRIRSSSSLTSTRSSKTRRMISIFRGDEVCRPCSEPTRDAVENVPKSVVAMGSSCGTLSMSRTIGSGNS